METSLTGDTPHDKTRRCTGLGFGRGVVPAWLAATLGLSLGGCEQRADSEVAGVLDWAAEDASRIAWLKTNGDTISTRSVKIWFPPDSVSRREVTDVSRQLDAAVPALVQLIGGPHEWQRHRGRIVIYLAPDRFVSHATPEGAVFIPASRAVDGSAPYLHEISHVLLRPKGLHTPSDFPDSVDAARVAATRPYWLTEGLPDFMAQEVAASHSFPEGDVFEMGGPLGADSTCASYQADASNAAIVAAVGELGPLSSLFTEARENIAPVFYTCAYSFTRFVALETSASFLASLFPTMAEGQVEERILEGTGRSMVEWRRLWRDQLDPRVP